LIPAKSEEVQRKTDGDLRGSLGKRY